MNTLTLEPIQEFAGPSEYLGDGAYIRFDGYAYIITAENGIEVQNAVSLEPDAIKTLNRFIERVTAKKQPPPVVDHPKVAALVSAKISEAKNLTEFADWFARNADRLAKVTDCGVCVVTYSNSIDFDNLTHPQIMVVIQAFPGRWNKTISHDGLHIDYESTFDGKTLRCWKGEPPPSCRIVEVEEVIPAQPETRRMVKKMECQPAVTDTPVAEDASILF